jgi:urease accessory protein
MNTEAAAGLTRFLLLQINDALFPIGAFAHSWGLETYIQKGLVTNAGDAGLWIAAYLRENFLYGDLLCARLAGEYAAEGNLAALLELEETARASKAPAESREAALKLGSRFVKTLRGILPAAGFTAGNFSGGAEFFAGYAEAATRRGGPTHAAAYGACAGAFGIPPPEALRSFLYAQASGLVTCCVKTAPLSQTEGQNLLAGLFGLMEALLRRLDGLEAENLYRASPGFELRAMEHETLYSRLYMS